MTELNCLDRNANTWIIYSDTQSLKSRSRYAARRKWADGELYRLRCPFPGSSRCPPHVEDGISRELRRQRTVAICAGEIVVRLQTSHPDASIT